MALTNLVRLFPSPALVLVLSAMLALVLGAPPARAQGNSAAARWVLNNVPPGQRGQLVSAGAKGTPVISTATPTATPTPSIPPTSTATPDINSCTGKADGTTCDAGLDWGTTLLCDDGECQACAVNDTATPRFVDNGDGTITDRQTCLVWEKKDDSGGIHDKDNEYIWSLRANDQGDCTVPSCPPNGPVFTVFLSTLNASRFAGHGDWRLPTSSGSEDPNAQAPQLESLIDHSIPDCGSFETDPVIPCTDPLFDVNCGIIPLNDISTGNPGCTVDGADGTEECSCVLNYYAWSFTNGGNVVVDPSGSAWTLWQTYGFKTAIFNKTFPHLARAMRGGVVFVP